MVQSLRDSIGLHLLSMSSSVYLKWCGLDPEV